MKINKGLLLGALGLGILGLGINQKFGKPIRYSDEWIRSLSNEQWNVERENIRKNFFCNPKLPEKIREDARRLLDVFDRIQREKYRPEEIGFPAHREHGWHLSKD